MRRRLWRTGEHGAQAATLLVLLLLILARSAGGQAPAKQPDPESLRISVDVALVVLHATVVDREGRLIHNLDEQDFEVFEDGRRQQIRLFKNEDIPVTAGLVVDHSSTMRRKLPEVSAAARTFVRSSNPEDEMFVVNFNEKVSLGLPDGIRFTDSAAELEAAITRAPAGGETALYDAIAKGLTVLQSGDRDGKVLVVISDGGDNASARKLTDVMKLARQSSAVIYTIGIFDDQDPDRNPAVLKRLAEETGGQSFVPKELTEVVAICERIARDIRHQYTIGYAPAHPGRDGAYRSVRVGARAKGRGKLSVRTRTGYIAGGDTPSDNRSRK